MKKIYFVIVIAILFCNSLYSQWAPVGAKWYYEMTPGGPPVLTIIESVKDTTILSKQCKELKTYVINYEMDSTGHYHYDTSYCHQLQYLHYDSSIVYLYDKTLNNFYILYNFNAIKGDTITVKNSLFPEYCPYQGSGGNLFQYKVDSIADTIIDGINLRKQFISATQNATWFFDDYPYHEYSIIERIGSLQYLFGEPKVQVLEGVVYYLRCYSDSNIFYHSPAWTDTLDCAFPIITNIKKLDNLQSTIKVFPNPVTTQAVLNFNNPNNAKFVFTIFDLSGMIINESETNSSSILIKKGDISSGIYFYKLYNKSNSDYYVGKIIFIN